MNICGFYPESINEGLGLRSVVFISGCEHYCKGCFSKETWDYNLGEKFTVNKQNEIIEQIKNNPLIDGVTLCGGDPFFSASEVIPFIKTLKITIPIINIWSYTGFTYEEIINSNDNNKINLLKECNVIIDGKFIQELKDITLAFRGSSNQRIINVQESLKQERVILWRETK